VRARPLYAKDLLKERPQDFAELVLSGACYIGTRESQYRRREIRLDTLIEVEYKGYSLLINVEFQSTRDGGMGERLLIYSYEAKREYELPVLSCVIYLQDVGEVSGPPLCWDVAGELRILWFNYVSIELGEKTTQELREMNLLGILPLFILSKGGQTHEVLDEVLNRLDAENEKELLALTRLFAELVFTSESEQAWLTRRFAMLQDIEGTPTYRRLVQKGREEGLEEGRLLEVRQNIEAIVRKRFPTSLTRVRAQIEQMNELEKLQEILLEASTARTAKRFEQYLQIV
jgi:hypothetical protein